MLTCKILGIALGVTLSTTASFGACPTNYAEGGGPFGEPQGVQSTAPIWNGNVICGTFSLDLIAGMAELSGGGAGGEYTCSSSLSASDTYQIVGPANAVPIPFEVHVHVTGNVTGGLGSYPNGTFCNTAHVTFKIASGATTDQHDDATISETCSGKSFDTGLVLNLAKLPGESFPLSMQLFGGWHGGSGLIHGDLTFAGLPEGYTIQSCQGYSGHPVPTVSRSWGNLKGAYR